MLSLAPLLAAALACAAQARPKDFDRFWEETRAELSKVPLTPALLYAADRSSPRAECFKASFTSLRGLRAHAWYCRPRGRGAFPAVLVNPWYAQGAIEPPRELAERGLAALWYQGRGFEVDLSSYPLENSWYILSGIESPKTYVYREMLSHAWRGLDFLLSRPEVDAERLGVMGSSQGGGLSLLLAGLDRRVRIAAADFPFLCDWEASWPRAKPPYQDVREFLARDPSKKNAVRATVSYFDVLNAAPKIRAPVLVQAGLKDETCPLEGIKAVYDRIGSRDKRLKLYEKAGHGDENAARWRSMVEFLLERLNARRDRP